jgi:hypothetical protein
MGNQRRVTLNPRYYAAKQLRELLLRLADGRADLEKIASNLRRRPRRRGKQI